MCWDLSWIIVKDEKWMLYIWNGRGCLYTYGIMQINWRPEEDHVGSKRGDRLVAQKHVKKYFKNLNICKASAGIHGNRPLDVFWCNVSPARRAWSLSAPLCHQLRHFWLNIAHWTGFTGSWCSHSYNISTPLNNIKNAITQKEFFRLEKFRLTKKTKDTMMAGRNFWGENMIFWRLLDGMRCTGHQVCTFYVLHQCDFFQ